MGVGDHHGRGFHQGGQRITSEPGLGGHLRGRRKNPGQSDLEQAGGPSAYTAAPTTTSPSLQAGPGGRRRRPDRQPAGRWPTLRVRAPTPLTFEYAVQAGDTDSDGLWLQTVSSATETGTVVFLESGATVTGGNPATSNTALTNLQCRPTSLVRHTLTLAAFTGGINSFGCSEGELHSHARSPATPFTFEGETSRRSAGLTGATSIRAGIISSNSSRFALVQRH